MRRCLPTPYLLLLLLAGCSQTWEETRPSAPPGGTGIISDGSLQEGDEAVSSVKQLPARGRAGAIEPFGTQGKSAAYEYSTGYKVGAGDRITVKVAGETDLSGDHLIDGSGNISMPFVQTVSVAGMTTAQIERLIRARLLNGFLKNPLVSVQVVTLRPFYILGEVNTSGSFAYQPGMTVQNAVAIAEAGRSSLLSV